MRRRLTAGDWRLAGTTRGLCGVALACAVLCMASSSARAQDATLFGEPLGGGDKALHVAASAAITVAGYGAATAVVDEPWQRAAVGAGLAGAAGLAKEGVDLLGFGTPSVVDLIYDAFGIMAGVGLALAFDAALSRADATAPAE